MLVYARNCSLGAIFSFYKKSYSSKKIKKSNIGNFDIAHSARNNASLEKCKLILSSRSSIKKEFKLKPFVVKSKSKRVI